MGYLKSTFASNCYESQRQIGGSELIQHAYRTRKVRNEFLYLCGQIIGIQIPANIMVKDKEGVQPDQQRFTFSGKKSRDGCILAAIGGDPSLCFEAQAKSINVFVLYK